MTVKTLALLGGAFLVLGGCAVPEESAPASSAAAGQQTEGVYRFNVGAMEAWSLKDGGMSVPNDGKIFNIDGTTAQTAEVLRRAGVADDKLELSINVLLLRAGDRMILLDSGLGPKAAASWARRWRQRESHPTGSPTSSSLTATGTISAGSSTRAAASPFPVRASTSPLRRSPRCARTPPTRRFSPPSRAS